MKRIKTVRKSNYTVMDNHILRDMTISSKSKGIFATIMSLSEDWDLNITGLSKILKEGKASIQSSFKELIEKGYCERFALKDDKGLFAGYEYVFYEVPSLKDDKREIEKLSKVYPSTENRPTDNQSQRSKEVKEVKKKEVTRVDDLKDLIPTEEEFLEFAMQEYPNKDKEHWRSKYKAWVANDWIDGNKNPITKWRSKVHGVAKYIEDKSIFRQSEPIPPYLKNRL